MFLVELVKWNYTIADRPSAVTLVPLTRPSTELVSITLDLVVLVDRLLMLLRDRYEVLALMRLRLEWDRARWTVVKDTRGMVDGLDRALERVFHGASNAEDSNKDGVHTMEQVSIDCGASDKQLPNQISQNHSRPSPTKPVPNRYSYQSQTTAASSSLLPSALSSATITHSAITNGALKEAGLLMDQMIDRAGPLKGLGGVEGPFQSKSKGLDGNNGEGTIEAGAGAVPDILLDIQDELEMEVTAASEQIQWANQVWKWHETSVSYLF